MRNLIQMDSKRLIFKKWFCAPCANSHHLELTKLTETNDNPAGRGSAECTLHLDCIHAALVVSTTQTLFQ
jgi:hypothetical protein